MSGCTSEFSSNKRARSESDAQEEVEIDEPPSSTTAVPFLLAKKPVWFEYKEWDKLSEEKRVDFWETMWENLDLREQAEFMVSRKGLGSIGLVYVAIDSSQKCDLYLKLFSFALPAG
jgi:hypothetical protein